MTAMSESHWHKYNEAGATQEARPRLLLTLDKLFQGSPALALDLGSGSGRDTKELLKRGWKVDAQDSDPTALKYLDELKIKYSNKLEIIPNPFEALSLPGNNYLLINASFSLPFCPPKHFPQLWNTIISTLKPGGILTCDLFGINDDWNKGADAHKLSFHSLEQAKELLRPLEILQLNEIEKDGATFAEAMKHSHQIICIAKKPS